MLGEEDGMLGRLCVNDKRDWLREEGVEIVDDTGAARDVSGMVLVGISVVVEMVAVGSIVLAVVSFEIVVLVGTTGSLVVLIAGTAIVVLVNSVLGFRLRVAEFTVEAIIELETGNSTKSGVSNTCIAAGEGPEPGKTTST